ARQNPEAFNLMVANTEHHLGCLYGDLGRYKETEKCLIEALNIKKNLAKTNPEAFLPELAASQNILAVLYHRLNRSEEGKRWFSSSWYSKACFESLKKNKKKSLGLLKNAIEFDEKYRKLAKIDENFDNIRDSKEFRKLIEK
ncbi:unnamed protein product, partial [marine sediment metagenome]